MTEIRVCMGPENRPWREAQVVYAQAIQVWEATPPHKRADKPERPDVRPAAMGDPIFCLRCAARIRVQLTELDDLAAVYLASSDGHRAPGGQGRVSGSHSPVSLSPATDAVDELYGCLHGWETAYRGVDPIPRRGYLAPAVTTVVAWLTQRLDGVLAHEDIAVDFARDVARWHRELVARAKAGTGKHSKRAPCPRCDLLALTWREGDRYVRCENQSCGRLMTLDEYEDYERSVVAAGLEEQQAS